MTPSPKDDDQTHSKLMKLNDCSPSRQFRVGHPRLSGRLSAPAPLKTDIFPMLKSVLFNYTGDQVTRSTHVYLRKEEQFYAWNPELDNSPPRSATCNALNLPAGWRRNYQAQLSSVA